MPLRRRSAVLQFALSGLLATLLIGAIAVAILEHLGTQQAIRDAKQVTRLAGEGIVAPALTPALLEERPAAIRALDLRVRDRVRRAGIVRVKLWRGDGTILYSDEPRLIGQRYRLGADEQATLRGSGVEAEVSDLSRPENRFERPQHKLLEVYLPIQGPDGRPLLFEAYQRFSSVTASGRRLWLAFAPALLGGLLLLQLINLPLARSMARRLHRGRQEREALLQAALDASQRERRAIAADLHDGVVQDLVGVSYALAAQVDRVGAIDPAAGAALRDGAAQTRDSIRALRTLLVDIYPPSLHQAGLSAALRDLATTFTARGLTTQLDGELDGLSDDSEQLLFRAAQELLQNAHKHAAAQHARIRLREDDDTVALELADDGRGFDPALAPDGHLGLQVLRDLAAERGGRLDVRSRAGEGTAVTIEVPR